MLLFCFVCVDALHPSQKTFNHARTVSCLPGLKSTKQWIKMCCSRLVILELATLRSPVLRSTINAPILSSKFNIPQTFPLSMRNLYQMSQFTQSAERTYLWGL